MVSITNSVEMDTLCRLCGSEEGIKVNIFESGSEHVKKIHKILPITVNEHDPLPKTMCHRCSFKVNEFYEFRANCIRAQELFKRKLPWLRSKQATPIEKGHRPMVEVTLNAVTSISPNEKQLPSELIVIEESEKVEDESMIVIEDDSPPYVDKTLLSNSFVSENSTQKDLVVRIKKSYLKKKGKTRSMWDTKKRRKKPRKSCKIAEVFTTSMDEYQNIGDIENDPLCIPLAAETNENSDTYSYSDKNTKHEHSNTGNGVLKEETSGENIPMPKHILITNIPRVGFVYTCERCGRTFLSPQPASVHICDSVTANEDNRSVEDDQQVSSNSNDYYSCNECDQIFTRHSQLTTHKKKHFEIESSSDDDFTPFNQRKKHHTKKTKPRLLKHNNVSMSYMPVEPVINRHSLLSSESE